MFIFFDINKNQEERAPSESLTKVLFIYEYTWQNFRLQLLHLVNKCVESIYKTQKS